MNTLFVMIFTIVSLVTRLVAPNLFTNTETAATPSNVEPLATAALETISEPEEPGILSVVRDSIATGTPVPPITAAVPTAQPGAAPIEIFGEAKINDTFERGSSGFGLSAGLNDDENIRIVALNNRLSLEPKKSNGWISWRLRPPVISQGAAEMEFSIITCARGDRTGIMMRAKDYNSGNGYYFSLSCEGTLSILRDSVVLNTADARAAFRNNSGDINILSAIVQGNTLTALLNGESLLTVQDDTYTEGFSGFFTAPQGEKTLTMDVLSFKEYYREQ